jgi:hypothetical protein
MRSSKHPAKDAGWPRWAPDGTHIVAKGDFVVEND